MTKKREPETQAVLEAKADVANIVENLRGVKADVLAVTRRLRRAAGTAPTIGTFDDGSEETAEGWVADALESIVRDEIAEAIRVLALEVRTDWRPEIRRVAAAERLHRARHHQVPASTEGPTVAEANRAAVLSAMQREGIRVHRVVGRT